MERQGIGEIGRAIRTGALLRRRSDLALAHLTLIVAVIAGVSCSGDSPTAPGNVTGPLQIVVPPSLVVNETALLTVTKRGRSGVQVPLPPLQWTSTDETIVRVEALAEGGSAYRVTALRRGMVTIKFSAEDLSAAVSLSVKARVAIRGQFGGQVRSVAIGESHQLAALFVDVDGRPIGETLPVTWGSGDPSVVSVSPIGVLTGIRLGSATITATSSDGTGSVEVTVADVTAGLPARVRFAHAADHRASVTFTPSQGAPVTLAFGESVELPVVSGTFGAHVHGQEFLSIPGVAGGVIAPRTDRQWLIRGGEHLEVYATRFGITGDFSHQASVPGSSGLVRFVQGAANAEALVVLLGPPGVAVGSASLINCYFDPLDMTEYPESQPARSMSSRGARACSSPAQAA